MIRTCPTCSAFYATPGLAFCVADGAPLVVIDPGSEKWEQGRRYFEKAEEIRKQVAWKRKRRGALVVTASVLVVALVVSVVTVNALILLKVLPNAPVADAPPSPPIAVANPQPTPDIQWPAPGAGTPESTPAPTPTPTPVATPSPLPSPKATPTITPVLIDTPTPPTTPTNTAPTPACSAVDREREKGAITGRYAEKWSSAARATPPNPPGGSERGVQTEVTFAGAEYSTTVLTSCVFASVNGTFIWQFRQTYNGHTKISTFTTQRSYNCDKNGNTWICH